MSDVPYKYLKEENEIFFPMIGPSSVSGEIPVDKGGTGATTASAARQNIGAISAVTVGSASGSNFILAIGEGGTGATTPSGARTNLGITVYHKLVKGTTSSAGNLVLGLTKGSHIVISVGTNRNQTGYYDTFYNLYPCGVDASNNWFVTAITPANGNTITNTAIAVDVWYIEDNSIDVE